METLYNIILRKADKVLDKDVIFKANDFILSDDKIYVGDGATKLESLTPVFTGSIKVGDLPALTATKITKLGGTFNFDDSTDLELIENTDSLNDALAKLQNQIIGIVNESQGG